MGVFDAVRDWRQRREAMRELRSIKRQEAPYEDFEKRRLLELMEQAAIREDPAFAARTWQQLADLDRDVAITSDRAISALIGLGLFDMAETAITAAIARFPFLASSAEHYAILARYRGDLEQAAIRWEQARQRFPDSLKAYVEGGDCLKWLGRTQEADALLAAAVAKAPDEYQPAAYYAGVAEHVKDWETALQRWTYVRERFGNPAGWVQSAACLREMGRDPEAEQILFQADTLFAGNLSVLTELGWIARRRQDWPEALLRWHRVREAFPRAIMGYLGASGTYQDMGNLAEADAILLSGVERNEDDADLYVEYARFAHNRGDWEEALRRWETIRQRFPDRPEGYDAAAAALNAMGRDQEASRVLAR